MKKLTNHPVHVKDHNVSFPSALIPFCEFGGNISVMGVKIENFDVHFCNSFKPTIIENQLCYTVDPNKYKDQIDLENDLSISLFINYNEEKEIALEGNEISGEDDYIIIGTIGMIILSIIILKF